MGVDGWGTLLLATLVFTGLRSKLNLNVYHTGQKHKDPRTGRTPVFAKTDVPERLPGQRGLGSETLPSPGEGNLAHVPSPL